MPKLFMTVSPSAKKFQSGYVALVAMLIIGAVGVVIVVSTILLGLGASRTSFTLEQSSQAKALANACAEESLQHIRDSTPYTGSDTLILGQGSCSYTVTTGGGQNRTITANGLVGTVIRKISISIDKINPEINITSWVEVAD